MIEKCNNCGRRVFGRGIREKFGIFCSIVCRNNFAHPGFCYACIGATTTASANDNITVFPLGFGFRFYGPGGDKCKTCGSVVQSQWLHSFHPGVSGWNVSCETCRAEPLCKP
jgi:hypothetical protein